MQSESSEDIWIQGHVCVNFTAWKQVGRLETLKKNIFFVIYYIKMKSYPKRPISPPYTFLYYLTLGPDQGPHSSERMGGYT